MGERRTTDPLSDISSGSVELTSLLSESILPIFQKKNVERLLKSKQFRFFLWLCIDPSIL